MPDATIPMPPCEHLRWDSDLFCLQIGRVLGGTVSPSEAEDVVAWARRRNVRCVYCLLDAADAASHRAVEGAGFHCVDIRVTLERTGLPLAPEGAAPPAGIEVGPCEPGDDEALVEIAGDVHDQTRFFKDANFPRDRSRRLYETWMRDSCAGAADMVLVARGANEPVGYVTCHASRSATGRIGLLGVARKARRRGAGGALLNACISWFGGRGIQRVTVVAQGHNAEALRLYESHGFRTRSVKLWWHLWLPGRQVGRD